MKDYDWVVVGAGIAGLYTGMLLRLRYPRDRIIVLEASSEPGGRASNTLFHGASVVTGAGIGRWKKDRRLRRLMNAVGLTPQPFVFQPHRLLPPSVGERLPRTLRQLQRHLHASDCHHTFREYGERVLGKEGYRAFVSATGYTDFHHQNACETVRQYGFDDVLPGWKGFSVPWKELIHRMTRVIGRRHIQYDHRVERISSSKSSKSSNGSKEDHTLELIVATPDGERTILSKQVVVATTVSTLRHLFPDHAPFRAIQAQPFLRLYARFDRASRSLMKEKVPAYTVVKGPLQKIIPVNGEKGLYMLSYSDNQDAKTVYAHRHDRRWLERQTERALHLPPRSLRITSVKALYFPEGTHYRRPLSSSLSSSSSRKTTIPPNVFVVGEAVSRHQGWVEGALETVDDWMRKKMND